MFQCYKCSTSVDVGKVASLQYDVAKLPYLLDVSLIILK